ncbi:hypothetical protein [Nostoc sp. CALU 1950]|uniref:hypothetical protein n=1 Tax=Nostoc sp. CALU 1950 TaxID=3104321 RepID=UPI003EBD2908
MALLNISLAKQYLGAMVLLKVWENGRDWGFDNRLDSVWQYLLREQGLLSASALRNLQIRDFQKIKYTDIEDVLTSIPETEFSPDNVRAASRREAE